MMIHNIQKIDEDFYEKVRNSHKKEIFLTFSEPRTYQFWEDLNNNFLYDFSNKVTLRIYGDNEDWGDFSFLNLLTYIRSLQLDTFQKINIGEVKTLKRLQHLRIGKLGWDTNSLRFLENFNKLESLTIEGEISDIDFIETLRELKYLSLIYNDLNNFTFLKALTNLQKLIICNNSKVENFDEIGYINKLIYLELVNLPQIKNINFISNLHNLISLAIKEIPQLRYFPNLGQCKKLGKILLKNFDSLNFVELARVRSLEELKIYDSDLDSNMIEGVVKNLPNLKVGYFEIEELDQLRNLMEVRGIKTNDISSDFYKRIARSN